MNRQSEFFFFFFTVQFYQSCLIPDETKKILGPKINPSNFQALISPSPEIFPWRIKWYGTPKKRNVNVCGWFICRTIHWLLLFLIWQSELRGQQHCTRAVLRQSDCFEYPLKFLLKSSYQKCLEIFIFSKVSYPQRNPSMKNFKTKKKSLYHLGNFNSPLPLQPPPRAGPRVKYYCLRCSFWLLVCW